MIETLQRGTPRNFGQDTPPRAATMSWLLMMVLALAAPAAAQRPAPPSPVSSSGALGDALGVLFDSLWSPPADTSVVEIVVSPASGPSIQPGDSVRFSAAALDSAGIPRGVAVSWAAEPASVATISPSGVARGVSPGRATITASIGTVSGSATLEVLAAPPPPPPPPPPPSSNWDGVVKDTLISGNLVIPAGQRWLIGANVRVAGNVLVENAVLGMRPGSSLKIDGANPSQYVGGGLHYVPQLNNDRGVWVWGSGQLDIDCTPKTGWNRTGADPSWLPGDEYWITATASGERAPRRWSPGQPIPRVDPKLPPAEVLNVTRDCVIEGPGHIHVHSTQPQKIQYVRLQTMGVTKPSQGMEGATSGRYALHLHFSGDGTRGSIIRGVACVDWRSRCFVPHASHGVTMIDNVAVNGWAEGFWWDPFDETDDLLVDALVVAGVNMPREYIGATPRFDAIALPAGRNTVIRNSVATGACCDKLSNGFDWPPNILDDRGSDDVTWEFNGGNVAHNNTGNGIRFWTNGRDVHVTGEYFGYRNATGRGIEAGAYRNGIQFHDITLVDDVALQAASPKLNTDREPPRWMRCDLTGPAGQPALVIGHRQQVPEEGVYTEFVDCSLTGTPKVLVENTGHPARLRFIRSNLTPQDVVIESGSGNEGLHIVIQNADGTGWEIRKVNGVVSVVQR